MLPSVQISAPEGSEFRIDWTAPLNAPALIDVEILSTLRGLERAGRVGEARAAMALADLADLAMDRWPHGPLLARAWQLRASLTAYDAQYVALAEVLDVALLTAVRPLARASGVRCEVQVLD